MGRKDQIKQTNRRLVADKERRDSVVECLTRDPGFVDSSLIVSLSKTLYPLLSADSSQVDKSPHN